MQNAKKIYLRNILSIVTAFLMIVAMIPTNVFAETYKEVENGQEVERTTDWSKEEIERLAQKSENWNLAPKNKLRGIASIEPARILSIKYLGSYVNDEGRDVARFVYTGKYTATQPLWQNLVIKVPNEFVGAVDFDYNGTGMYPGWDTGGVLHDHYHGQRRAQSDAPIMKFEKATIGDVGSENCYRIRLNKNDNVPSLGSNLNIPIDFVLKDGKKLSDFKNDLLFQARVYNDNLTQIYTSSEGSDQTYTAYTFSTILPAFKNYEKYIGMHLATSGESNGDFGGAKVHTKFNLEDGYVDVYYKQYKGNTQAYANERYGLRQSVDKDFYQILKPDQDNNVGEIFIADKNGEHYSNFYESPGKPDPNRIVRINKDAINYIDDVGFIQVVNTGKWDTSHEYQDGVKSIKTQNNINDAILNFASTGANQGVYTVIRYYVNSEKVREALKDNGMKFYTFHTAIVRQNKDGIREFSTVTDKERVIHKDETVSITFDKGYEGGQYVELIIGEGARQIYFADSISQENWRRLQYNWKLPMGITIPKDTKITVRVKGLEQNTCSLTFPGVLDQIQLTDKEDNYEPQYYRHSDAMSGGVIQRSELKPNVDEIFTDSTKITGHTMYEGAEIKIKNPDNDKLKEQVISALAAKSNDVDKDAPLTDAKDVNGKTFKAWGFDTEKPNQGSYVQKINNTENKFEFEMPKLERDMPILFSNKDMIGQNLESKPDVIEQVQTKFHFDLNGVKSKTNLDVLDKIAPLSKEYKYDPETGKANANYKASGFEGDNVKYADENNKTIEVDGRTYQNVANHDGLKYDLSKADQKEAFLMRQMPTKDDVDVPQGKRILGWTTKKLVDTNDKTVVDQFNELKDAGKIVKDVADWANVDKDQTYIFDANSPIDKERTVYAVYGEGINIVLHSNNTADLKDETIITIPVTISDVDNTNDILDAVTSPTLSKMKGNLIIKELPKVPVTGEQSEIDKITDEKAKYFYKPNNSFLGWTLYRYDNDPQTSELIAGKNNERIGEIVDGLVANGTKRIPKNTEWVKDLKGNEFKFTRYIPNTFSVALRSEDVPSMDNNQGAGAYNALSDAIDEGKDLHLYANYRPFFDIKVYPSYKNIDKTQGDHGKYVDTVEEAKKHTVNVGLLHRTAVTDYGTPTVHQNANYYPLEGGASTLKTWDGKSTAPLVWKLPGFDELGQRKSYVSVIVTDDKKEAYENFKSPNWNTLGAKTYIRLQDETATQDPNAPKNLHENAGNPYGDPVAKDQTFTVDVDAFTSATSRKSELSTGDSAEVIGYEIWNTSTPIDVIKPVFDNVFDDETEAKLQWTDAEKNAGIEKIILKVADGAETTLVKQLNGIYTDGTITATPNGDKLVLSPLNLTGKAGQDIVAKYVVKKNEQEVTGPAGRITINERGQAEPVTDMKQIHNGDDGESKIQFTVPNPTLNKPTKDTVYTAQKWDKTQGKWVDLGKVTLESDDEMGKPKEITLDKEVEDGDIVRIKTEQPNLLPSDSTGTGKANYTPQDGDENRKYVKIDKAGPKADVKAKDEEFRRFIDLEGTIDEIPYERKVTISIDYKDGNAATEYSKEIITQKDKDSLIKELNTVLRKGIEEGNIPEIKIVAVDKFGNSETSDVNYTESYQLKVFITGERAGKKFVKVSADKANATITIKVMNGGQEVTTAQATVTTPNEFVKVKFANGYVLKSGDELVISGTASEGDKTYTSNPFKRAIK